MIPINIYSIFSRHPLMRNIRNAQNINTPDDLAQMLLNSGKVNQEQVNQAKQMWGQRQDLRKQIHDQFGF